MLTIRSIAIVLLAVMGVQQSQGFCSPSSRLQGVTVQRKSASLARTNSVALSERRWNFNEGQTPWGMKGNAEIWNGRVAQVSRLFLNVRIMSFYSIQYSLF
jgi:hypothetical protein